MIKLSEVKKAYKEIEYTPITEEWILESEKKCCALSALAIQDGIEPEFNSLNRYLGKRFGEDFVTGFIAGFDNCVFNDSYDKEAYDNGVKIRKGLHV